MVFPKSLCPVFPCLKIAVTVKGRLRLPVHTPGKLGWGLSPLTLLLVLDEDTRLQAHQGVKFGNVVDKGRSWD